MRTKLDIYVFFINRKTVERGKIDTPNAHAHAHAQLTIAAFKYPV
jgi:hypothetical protein